MASARFTYVEETGIKSVSCKANRSQETKTKSGERGGRSEAGFGQRINKQAAAAAAGPRVGAVPGPLCAYRKEGRTEGSNTQKPQETCLLFPYASATYPQSLSLFQQDVRSSVCAEL